MVMKNRTKAARTEHGKQGFASMPKDKVKEIARKGGKSSHSGGSSNSRTEKGSNKSSRAKQGFASMIKDKVKEIANKSGINR
ncbi:hypothetical protein IM40_08940 [Candidatus Paracaedimonas acanthamoebae]|nr:hypothetical protein IM40_08940 [Candidatus Paracaedimonas acanthamoebae]